MVAGGADFRCLFADNDVAAVSAFPNFNRTLGKHLCCLHIMKQCPIALLMMLFNGRNQTESGGQLREALLLGGFGKTLVHIRPFVIFALGSGF